jgi:hypothetical protein
MARLHVYCLLLYNLLANKLVLRHVADGATSATIPDSYCTSE